MNVYMRVFFGRGYQKSTVGEGTVWRQAGGGRWGDTQRGVLGAEAAAKVEPLSITCLAHLSELSPHCLLTEGDLDPFVSQVGSCTLVGVGMKIGDTLSRETEVSLSLE